jgi:hypothetical protein
MRKREWGGRQMDNNLIGRIRLEALITEREGMLVMNRERELHQSSPAYGEKEFYDLANRMMEIINGL